jgi:rhodanese-related sulfurtransferase
MDQRDVKDTLYEQLARIGKAVSSPKRLELLDLLCQGEKPVDTLAGQADLTVKNTSAHLRVLRGARLVRTRREGQRVYYRLADEEVCSFFLSLRALAEKRLVELREVVRQYFTDPEQLTPLDRQALLDRVRRGAVTVIDVRPEEEYREGHIPGARSVPLRKLTGQLRSLPLDQEIVAYCRGPYCFLALDAVSFLRDHGYRARRLEDGVAEWKAAGFPVVRQEGALV